MFLCVYLDWLQQQAGTQETGKTGDEPHHGHVVTEPVTSPYRNAIGQSDPCPAAPQGCTSTPGRKPSWTTHVCHNWIVKNKLINIKKVVKQSSVERGTERT